MALRDAALEAGWQVVAGHCLDLADSSLPYLPFSEILGRADGRPARRRRPRARAAPHPRPPPAGPPDPQQRDRVGRPGPRPRQRLRRVRRPPRRRRRAGARSSSSSRTPTGPTSRPATCSASSSPARSRASRLVVSYRSDDLHRRHPLRRQVGRVDAPARRRPAPGRAAPRRRRTPPRPGAAPLDDVRGRVRLRSSTAPRATRSSSRSSSAPPGPGRSPASSPTCCWSASTGSTRPPVTSCGSSRSPAARSATSCSPRSPTSAPPSSRPRCATPSSPTCSSPSRGGTYAFRHALLGEAVYDDLLPGERVRLHADFVVRARARAAPSARRPSWPSTPAGPTTGPVAVRASIEAGEEALRRRRSVRGGHPLPRRARADRHLPRAGAPTSTPTPSSAACAEALIAAGRVPKAVKVLRARLAALPPDGSDVDRGQLLTSLAAGADAHRHDRVAARDRGRGGRAAARRARPSCWPAPSSSTPRASAAGTPTRRARWRSRRSTIAERNDLTSLAVELHTTLAGLDPDRQRRRPSAGWRAAAERARAAGPDRARAARPLLPRPASTTTAATSTRPWRSTGEVIARSEVGGLTWSPFPAEARLLLAVALTHQGRLDEAWDCSTSAARTRRWSTSGSTSPTRCSSRSASAASRKPKALERLRDYWGTDGLIAIIAGERRADAGRARPATPHARVRGLRRRGRRRSSRCGTSWFQARLRLADPRRRRARQRRAARQSADERERRGADVERHAVRRRPRHRLLRRPTTAATAPSTACGSRGAPPSTCAGAGSPRSTRPPATSSSPAWRAAEETARRLRQRARDRAGPRAAGRGAAGDRRRRGGPRGRPTWRATPPTRCGAAPLLAELTALGSAPAPATATDAATLTPREPEILALVAEGRVQRRDRQAAVHQHQDGLGARLQHPRQARRGLPHRGGRGRPAPRAAVRRC